jgi:hypothetical protein
MDHVSNWKERESTLLRDVRERLQYYQSVRKTARILQRVTSSVVMIGSILAPTSIATSAGNTMDPGFLGTAGTSTALISLMITLAVAITEGFRRIFRFEQRWASAWLSGQKLHMARERYYDSIVGLEFGGDAWKIELMNLRKAVNETMTLDGEEFFQSVKDLEPVDRKPAEQS